MRRKKRLKQGPGGIALGIDVGSIASLPAAVKQIAAEFTVFTAFLQVWNFIDSKIDIGMKRR